MMINDIPMTIPFRIKDINSGNYIFSILNPSDGGDLPFDIAFLPVVAIYAANDELIIETEV